MERGPTEESRKSRAKEVLRRGLRTQNTRSRYEGTMRHEGVEPSVVRLNSCGLWGVRYGYPPRSRLCENKYIIRDRIECLPETILNHLPFYITNYRRTGHVTHGTIPTTTSECRLSKKYEESEGTRIQPVY